MKNNLEDQIKSIEKEKSKNINVKDLEINRLEENMKKLQHDFELQNKIIEEEKNTLDKMKNFFEEKINILELEKIKSITISNTQKNLKQLRVK